MREWFTARELAGLPGLPKTESGTIRRAKKQEWQFRKRAGRGGGREYSLDDLPSETQRLLKSSYGKLRKVLDFFGLEGVFYGR